MIDPETLQVAIGPLSLGTAERHELAAAIERRCRVGIRLRPGVDPASLPFDVTPVAWHARGFQATQEVRPAAFLPYAKGEYYIQDVGSLLAVALLDARPSEWICDLCAAPGGKATAIAEVLGPGGWLLANEAVHSRLGPLEFNLARHGAVQYTISRLDPDRLAEQLANQTANQPANQLTNRRTDQRTDQPGGLFDAVLVDAPCSGQSLLGLGKQSASAFTSQAIDHCAARQGRILDAAAALVRPGGRLIYSTCTFAYQENEGQVLRFLQSHSHWKLAPCESLAPWQSPGHPGCYRLWPHRDQCAGAFAAAMYHSNDPQHHVDPLDGDDHQEMTAQERGASSGGGRRRRSGSNRLQRGDLPKDFDQWGQLDPVSLWAAADVLYGWPEEPSNALQAVAAGGPEVAFRKQTTWFPSYALAMRRDPSWQPIAQVELEDQHACQYLEGLSVPCSIRGWAVACHQGRPLGWIKGDCRQGKNHLPKQGRLRILHGQ